MVDDEEPTSGAEVETPPELTEQRFAANLRTFREDKGISQGRLAEEMSARGWPWRQQTVARVESGRRTVRLGEATAIAEILGTGLVHLTASTLEATFLRLLGGAAERASDAYCEIADQTGNLLHAQRLLLRSINDAEQTGYRTSPAVAQAADEGAEALRWTPEQAVRKGRHEFQTALPPDTDDVADPISGTFSPEAVRAALAIQSQASLTAVTPEDVTRVTAGMGPGEVDAVIAAVAETARQEKNGTVLRHIRKAGLERLAAEGIAAEWGRRTHDGNSREELDQFIGSVFTAVSGGPSAWESARNAALEYVEGGGTSLFAMAELIIARMPTENLPAFVPLRETSLSEITSSRDTSTRATRPQRVLTLDDDKDRS